MVVLRWGHLDRGCVKVVIYNTWLFYNEVISDMDVLYEGHL